ncbi:MAG: ABC transporter permease [Spirochaetes bacterium]|nr:MAG: ABC transporter permease [Spirochaetota bacterium]
MKLFIKVERRDSTSIPLTIAVILLSLLIGFCLIAGLLAIQGIDPLFALGKIFAGSFGRIYGIGETITKGIPLILIGGGLALAFRAKFWNIGAEGQLLSGAILSTWIALNWAPHLPAVIVIPLMFLAGFLGGAVWGFFPALFKVRFGVNEVISTLMMNYIIAEFLNMLILGPWRGESRMGFPYTDSFPPSATLYQLPNSRVHLFTLILALCFAFLLFLLIYRTKFGYEVRVIGENRDAARYAGIDFFRNTIILMVISGGMAGMAGVGEVAGIHHHLTYPQMISSGYGYTGIIVAWLAKLNPLLAIISGLFLAGILVGGDAVQISLGLPAATVHVFNGILLFSLIMGDYFLLNRLLITIRRDRAEGRTGGV